MFLSLSLSFSLSLKSMNISSDEDLKKKKKKEDLGSQLAQVRGEGEAGRWALGCQSVWVGEDIGGWGGYRGVGKEAGSTDNSFQETTNWP